MPNPPRRSRAPTAGPRPTGGARTGSPAPAVSPSDIKQISSPGASRRHWPRRSGTNRITGTGSVPLGHRADRQPGAPAAGTGPAGTPKARSSAPTVATSDIEQIGSPGASRRHRPSRNTASRIHQHRQCPPRTSSRSAARARAAGTGPAGMPRTGSPAPAVSPQTSNRSAPPERREPDHRQWPLWAPSSSAAAGTARAPRAGHQSIHGFADIKLDR